MNSQEILQTVKTWNLDKREHFEELASKYQYYAGFKKYIAESMAYNDIVGIQIELPPMQKLIRASRT